MNIHLEITAYGTTVIVDSNYLFEIERSGKRSSRT
jgi:hypothetical protein